MTTPHAVYAQCSARRREAREAGNKNYPRSRYNAWKTCVDCDEVYSDPQLRVYISDMYAAMNAPFLQHVPSLSWNMCLNVCSQRSMC